MLFWISTCELWQSMSLYGLFMDKQTWLWIEKHIILFCTKCSILFNICIVIYVTTTVWWCTTICTSLHPKACFPIMDVYPRLFWRPLNAPWRGTTNHISPSRKTFDLEIRLPLIGCAGSREFLNIVCLNFTMCICTESVRTSRLLYRTLLFKLLYSFASQPEEGLL